MKKINKIKKGIVKYFNAEIECKCVDANTFKMSVNDKNIFVCEVCHGENNPYLGIRTGTDNSENFKIGVAYQNKLKKKHKGFIFSSSNAKETKLQNKLFAIQNFLKLVKSEGYAGSITRKEIIALEKKYDKKLKPTWLMKDKHYHLKAGVYKLERFNFIESRIRNTYDPSNHLHFGEGNA